VVSHARGRDGRLEGVSSPAATAPAPVVWVGTRLERARTWVLSIRPAYVLTFLCVVQTLAVLALALTVRHNGWLYYAGGDQLWHYSGAYLLAHGHLPPSYVGYGWSILLAPLAAIAGPNLVSALPAIVLFNTLILLPLGLLCVYGIASRIAGRLFGYFTSALWIAFPYLGILFVEPGYHQKYTELTLPQLLGLTSVPDFPAMVALIGSAYLCIRAVETRLASFAAAAGLGAGASIAIKPSNSIFLAVPFVFLLAERWRALLPFAAGLAPALLALAVWKFRGLGELAAAPAVTIRSASGVSDLINRIHGSDLNSWAHLRQVLDGLREHFWVARVIEWLPVAGAVALLLRSRRGFLLIVPWFAVFLLLKGTYIPASVDDASIWRILMPAYPAYLLLAAAVVLLVPRVRARPATTKPPGWGSRQRAALSGIAVAAALVPLGVVTLTPRLNDHGHSALRYGDNLIPVSDVGLRAADSGDAVRLTWRPTKTRAAVFFRVLRTPDPNGGVYCAGKTRVASSDCEFFTNVPATLRQTSFVDHPGHGTWHYRIGVSANWANDETLGDVYVLSPDVSVTVP
jgi:hypothetical protein